jgi:pimeloyl-ACP methyl ester carboxylesterase
MVVMEQRSTRTFTSSDGLEIAYHEWAPDAPGPPIVLHHGFPSNAELGWVLTGVVDALVSHGRHVVAIDSRGSGASAKPHDPRYYSLELMAGDVSGLIDALSAPAIDLVGYSLGALVALLAASMDPRVRRLVVGGVGGGAVELGVSTTRLVPRSMEAGVSAPSMDRLTDPHEIGTRAIAEAVGADLVALRVLARATRTQPIPLGDITAPTLIVVGAHDGLAKGVDRLAAAVANSRLLQVDHDHVGALRSPEFLSGVIGYLEDPDGSVEG